METYQFVYWLQGFAELNQGPPTPEQWQSIREHLQTVFTKVTQPAQIQTILGPAYPTSPTIPPSIDPSKWTITC